MKQYNAIKAKYPGALLLFRVGDFYETFGEDAIRASEILDIVLTKRSNGSASEVELAGFPHHALDNYLPRLVRAGNRVAICDQLEDPKSVKGIVKRGVTELVTPGLSFNDNVLDRKRNNFLASIHYENDNSLGIAFLDLSTGQFMTSQGHAAYISKLIQGFQPAEVIFCKRQKTEISRFIPDNGARYMLDEWVFSEDFANEKLLQQFRTSSLKGFGIDRMKNGIIAAGAILHYLDETEHRETAHISSIGRLDEDKHVWLDKFTIRNLELVYPQQEGGVALIQILDKTTTPMGSRLLRQWLVLPLRDPEKIRDRHEIVSSLVKDGNLLTDLESHLKKIGDLERLISKVATRRINPRELSQLRKSMLILPSIAELLAAQGDPGLNEIAIKLDPCIELIERLQKELKEEVPMVTHQGNIICDGVDETLDELRAIAFSGKDYLVQIQQRECERTGIPSLKIAYNKVFGYYLEVSNTHKNKVPQEWIRKQTLVNAERYITEELKVYEEKILNAEEKLVAIEQDLFSRMVEFAGDFTHRIQQNARAIARLDCLMSFARVALQNRYVCPQVNDSLTIDIRQGRHAVIEKQLPPGEPYVPNDVYLDNDHQQIMVITGPNMAGKSALLRQTALIVLMAQMGSFVPAESAAIGIIDKVFTRVGASDNLAKGESTFMVEMTETASILNNLNNRSLVLMDEIGRGTSTYDGVSIAWSILEFLHNHPDHRPKTLFATHYHELNQLSEDFVRIHNFNVSVKEAGDKILFMRTLKEGGSEHSFGIHVAQLAGMPNKVVIRANEILHFLEKDKRKNDTSKKLSEVPKANYQLNLFEADPRFKNVEELLNALDINTISPVEALLKLNEIKTVLQNKS
nr:DNA mismatch repair protein MutS [Fulvivirga sedimenti]